MAMVAERPLADTAAQSADVRVRLIDRASRGHHGEVVALARARLAARAARDFAEADRLREEIAGAGWEVRDVETGYELVPLA